jgi:CheY-like chemotaxis protein
MNTIYLVDDDEIFNFLSHRIVKQSGLFESIYICSSAKKALELLKNQDITTDSYTLILLDIMMPVMDGFVFLDELQKLPQEIVHHAKVAMLTSSLEPEDRERAFTYPQVLQFLTKPLTNDMLIDLVNEIQ